MKRRSLRLLIVAGTLAARLAGRSAEDPVAELLDSLGCWSDWRPFREGKRPMPYFPR